MIPSANSTGGHLTVWHADNWAADHPAGVAAATVYNASASSSGSTAPPADHHSRYLTLHRHQILDWENAMLLATHHSNATTPTATTNHDSVYDQVSDYSKAAGITPIHADALSSLSQPRHYEDLLSVHMAASSSNSTSFANNVNAWGLLNTVCSRSSGASLQQEPSVLHTVGSQYGYDGLNGAAEGIMGGYGNLGAAVAAGMYAESLRSSNSNGIGLTSFDQRRLDDIMKRDLYTTHDFNSRLGLNLGGRTYFSADDFGFGRWGKRPRPNSPGCIMQPAPLCQAEGCKADLSMAKHYHRRHKVCEYHSKAATVHIGDQTQRFCQQCSRFHVLDEFDDGKRSCRKRLADHNRRRRKPQPTPTTQQLAVDATASTTADAEAVADQPTATKEHSQEATTGSESLQTAGAGSCKESPLPAAGDPDRPKTASTSTPAASSMANNNEASSNKANEQEKVQQHDQGKPTRSHATSNGTNQQTETMASPGTSHLAATLSLGGPTDILDVKPPTHMIHASILNDSHDRDSFENSLSANKHAVVMPWLQGPKKNQNMQGLSYAEGTRDTATGEAVNHRPYADRTMSFKAVASADYKESNSSSRSSWMIKGMTAEGSENDANALLINSRYAGSSKSGSGGAGGHELLRFLSDERELLNTDKHTPMQASTGNSIGTLAFLDQSIDPSSTFTISDQHRVLRFSNLQQSETDHQGATSLNRGSSSGIAFDNRNHNHGRML